MDSVEALSVAGVEGCWYAPAMCLVFSERSQKPGVWLSGIALRVPSPTPAKKTETNTSRLAHGLWLALLRLLRCMTHGVHTFYVGAEDSNSVPLCVEQAL